MKTFVFLILAFVSLSACGSKSNSGGGQPTSDPTTMTPRSIPKNSIDSSLPSGNTALPFLGKFQITKFSRIYGWDSNKSSYSETWLASQNKGLCTDVDSEGRKQVMECTSVGKLTNVVPYFVTPQDQCISKIPTNISPVGSFVLDACMQSRKKGEDIGDRESLQFTVSKQSYEEVWVLVDRVQGFAEHSRKLTLHEDGSQTLVQIERSKKDPYHPGGEYSETLTFELTPVSN